MEELERPSDIGQAASGHGQLIWAAQGQGGEDLGPGVRAWRYGGGVGGGQPEPATEPARGEGDSADAVVLVRQVLAEVGASYRVLGEAALIDALVRQLPGLVPVHDFFRMETTSPSGVATAGVRWLDAREEKQATSLFDRFFPDSFAQPGHAGVGRGGVITHPAARGRGLARTVSGFVLDSLVSRAALMVLTGNAPAIATYERLGMVKRRFGAAHIPAR